MVKLEKQAPSESFEIIQATVKDIIPLYLGDPNNPEMINQARTIAINFIEDLKNYGSTLELQWLYQELEKLGLNSLIPNDRPREQIDTPPAFPGFKQLLEDIEKL